MRPIKFRAWDQLNKKVLSDGLPHLGEGKYFYLNQMISLCAEQMMDLMQFTGLHDKNGKEIYEGDILKIYPKEHLKSEAGDIYTEPVKFIDSAFRVSWGVVGTHMAECWDFEVIGNIHENQDLIKEAT